MPDEARHTHWLDRLATLKVDKVRGDPAPHKPLLLLVLCDLAEEGCLGQKRLVLTGEIAFRFASYWTVVAKRRRQPPDVRLPFYHLKGDGLLIPFDKHGNPATDKKVNFKVELEPELVDCLQNGEFRSQARLLLALTYFLVEEQIALAALLNLRLPDADVLKEEGVASSQTIAVQTGREAKFRLTVVPAYNYTCALTRYRLVTIDAGALVDAAHIHQFADSRNNSPSNGLALSKNAHWMFDKGLWSLNDDWCVIVKQDRFAEAGPTDMRLDNYQGNRILLPADGSLWPSLKSLAWHRRTHGY